eukprot:SAG31_NODE_1030_length_10250_cov_2.791942_3_plen_664_part_00
MVDVRTVVDGAQERILKDKFFRIATNLFERTGISRLCSDPNQTRYTCLQVGSRHRKVWDRIGTNKGNFNSDVESIYEVLGHAMACDNVDSVEQCMARLRNKICLYLKQLRQHIMWLKRPVPNLYEGEWRSHEGSSLTIKRAGTGLIITCEQTTLAARGVCSDYFTVSWTPWGHRHRVTTFRRVPPNILEESFGAGNRVRHWKRVQSATENSSTIRAPSALHKTTPTPKRVAAKRRRRPREAICMPFDAGEITATGQQEDITQIRLSFAEVERNFQSPVDPGDESDPASGLNLQPEPESNTGSNAEQEAAAIFTSFPPAALRERTKTSDNSIAGLSPSAPRRSRLHSLKNSVATPRKDHVVVKATLDSIPLVQQFTDEQMKHIISKFASCEHSCGDTIIEQGLPIDVNSELSIICEGTVTVSVNGSSTRSLGPGNAFGALALVPEKNWDASIIVQSESVRLATIRRTIFWDALQHTMMQSSKVNDGWQNAERHFADLKTEIESMRGTLWSQQDQRGAQLLDAEQVEIIGLEEAIGDLNELAAAAWRALKICKEFHATRFAINAEADSKDHMRLYLILARFVRRYRTRKAQTVAAEFSSDEPVIIRIQARIRGFLARRRKLHEAAQNMGTTAANSDVRGIVQSEVEFWDWPRVSGFSNHAHILEH